MPLSLAAGHLIEWRLGHMVSWLLQPGFSVSSYIVRFRLFVRKIGNTVKLNGNTTFRSREEEIKGADLFVFAQQNLLAMYHDQER